MAVQAFVLLLAFLHCKTPTAVRPTLAEQGKHHSQEGSNDTEALTIAHSATMRHGDHGNRQQRSDLQDPQAIALLEFARADLFHEKPQAQKEKLGKDEEDEFEDALDRLGEQENQGAKATESAPAPAAAKTGSGQSEGSKASSNSGSDKKGAKASDSDRESSAEDASDQKGAAKGKPGDTKDTPGQLLVIPEARKNAPITKSKTGEEAVKKRVFNKYAHIPQVAGAGKNPLAELFSDTGNGKDEVNTVQHAARNKDEAMQELDDLIEDGTEASRITGRAARRLYRFFDKQRRRHMLVNGFVYFFALFLGLGLYFMWFQYRQVPREQDFRYGICECLGDFRICLCGFCCPAIRWADTVSDQKGGYLNFVAAFLLLLVLLSMCWHPTTGGLAWLLIVVVGVHYRQKIRLKSGIESGTPATMIQDVFAWTFFSWCAIVQEARQVDEMVHASDSDLDDSSVGNKSADSRSEQW